MCYIHAGWAGHEDCQQCKQVERSIGHEPDHVEYSNYYWKQQHPKYEVKEIRIFGIKIGEIS